MSDQRPSSASVLVVEDDELISTLLKFLLERERYTVHLAADGMEALKIATERNLDALVLDLAMPNMTGYEVARQLRAKGLIAPQVKLIALSGWARPADKLDALEAGFDHHLTKPIDVEGLHELLSLDSVQPAH